MKRNEHSLERRPCKGVDYAPRAGILRLRATPASLVQGIFDWPDGGRLTGVTLLSGIRGGAGRPERELANFDDDEGHIVGEGAMPPRSHTVEDRLLHFWQFELCRIEDQL